MNLLADEGVDRPIVERLRQEGFTVSGQSPFSLFQRHTSLCLTSSSQCSL